MNEVITIDIEALQRLRQLKDQKTKASRKLSDGLIQPADKTQPVESVVEHAAEPIKRIEDIDRICKYLLENERYRDHMLFVVGINFGLRISDLLRLRFSDLINKDLTFKDTFPILEKKTRNTRKVRSNRYVSINDAVINAVTLYLEHVPSKMDDFLFRSESNRGSNQNKPLSRMSADRILKEIAEALHLNIRMSTHSLRKTFGYHQMVMGNNDPRRLLLLQKIFGHSSAMQTLTYIGITEEEIEDAYMKLNLGIENHYVIDSQIGETTNA